MKDIEIPDYMRHMKACKKGTQKQKTIAGADTETYEGKPICFQTFFEKTGPSLVWCDETSITHKFLEHLDGIPLKDGCNQVFIFFHNLAFDLPILLYPIMENFEDNEFQEEYDGWNIDVICNKMFAATLTPPNSQKKIRLLDSFKFLPMSLKRACEVVGIKEKYKTPKNIGQKRFTEKDKYFVEYALNDAHIEYLLGEYITGIHHKFNVPMSISLPQMAQRIFMKNYFPKDVILDLPGNHILNASLLSYHGGKNGYYIKGVQKINNVFQLDVVSMYPWAMKQLPPWTAGHYESRYFFDWKNAGIYEIEGEIKDCKYPIIPDHNFKYKSGRVKKTWVNGYEIAEALNTDELKLEKISGFAWIPDADAVNPFIDYVDYFFEQKKKAKNEDRAIMKLLQNSLYGKTIQHINYEGSPILYVEKNEYGNKTSEWVNPEYKAGGLFNPFIASCITSKARQILHQIEHKYEALDCSTDSIKTLMTPDPQDIGEDLGQLKIEAYGTTLFFRNKLYIMYDMERGVKYARHGFQGTRKDLEKIYKTHNTTYFNKRLLKVREARLRGLAPFVVANNGLGIAQKLNLPGFEHINPLKPMIECVQNDLMDHKALKDSSLNTREQKQVYSDLIKDNLRS